MMGMGIFELLLLLVVGIVVIGIPILAIGLLIIVSSKRKDPKE